MGYTLYLTEETMSPRLIPTLSISVSGFRVSIVLLFLRPDVWKGSFVTLRCLEREGTSREGGPSGEITSLPVKPTHPSPLPLTYPFSVLNEK